MRALSAVLLVVQLLGLALLLVGLLSQARRTPKRVTPATRDGVGAAFLAGLIRVPVQQAAGRHVGGLGTVVELLLALVVLVLVSANLPRPRIAVGLWAALVVLAVVEVVLVLT